MRISDTVARFIVLEGIDGAGTTTQAERVAAVLRMQGRSVYVTREPSDSDIGKLVRRRLLHQDGQVPTAPSEMALLYAADRMHHCQKEIGPHLQMGEDVICDRYLLSSLVYQGLDLEVEWLNSINQHALVPHKIILLDVDVKVAQERVTARNTTVEIFDARSIQERLRERYLALADQLHIQIIDGNAAIEIVTQRIIQAL